MELNKFELRRNDKCLCGSNKKYKQCCLMIQDRYKSNLDTDKALKNGNYELAFSYCNADLTKYLVSMKRHTEPLIFRGKRGVSYFLDVDMKALDEIFGKLAYIIYHGKIYVDVDTRFELLESVIDNSEYFELVRYHRILFMSMFCDDNDKIKDLLIELNFKDISNVRLLELYCEHISDNLERTNLHRLYDKIIDLEDNIYYRIKFLSMKAVDYYLNKETRESEVINCKVTGLLESLTNDTEDYYEQFIISKATFYSGIISNDKDVIANSIILYKKILDFKKECLTSEILSNIYNEVGESYIMLGEYSLAIESFKKAYDEKNNCLSFINVARAYIRLNDYESAYIVIKKIPPEQVLARNMLDYLLTMGSILTVIKDYGLAMEVYSSLKDFTVQENIFDEYKMELIISMLEEYRGFSKYKRSSSFANKIKEVNGILELKPNFFGVGLNINAIISMFTQKEEFHD